MKHKHHDAIVAWAGGAEIQHRAPNSTEWKDNADPAWVEDYEYRVKPAEPEYAYPKLDVDAVKSIADYFCLQIGTIDLVSQRSLRYAIDAGQVVTREEFDRVAAELKATQMAHGYLRAAVSGVKP